ncbi:hypothetical protein DRP04_08875 [Archaeoglobales archaeon]|nr:MAG: hypothetical protein DRP04_08875 [Archaeoglobales archaeon]
MPAYIFGKEAFLRFLEGHLDEDTVVVLSSDITEFKKEEMESYVGKKEYYLVEFGVPADILNIGEEEFDELMKYAVVFIEKDMLSEVGKKNIRE